MKRMEWPKICAIPTEYLNTEKTRKWALKMLAMTFSRGPFSQSMSLANGIHATQLVRFDMNRRDKQIPPNGVSTTVFSAPDHLLLNPIFQQSIAIHWRSFRHEGKRATRRSIPDIIANIWRDFDGRAINPNGTEYELGDIDEIFGGDIDPEFGRIRRILEWALNPTKRTLTDEQIEQMRLLDLTIRIAGPRYWEG